jgi:hypothetical protein
MTQREYKEFEICLKSLKSMAVQSQQYEFAANLRDIEKDLTIPALSFDQTPIDWVKVSSLDSFQYYDRILRLIEKFSKEKDKEIIEIFLKPLYEVVHRSVIRQEIISKILGEDEHQ